MGTYQGASVMIVCACVCVCVWIGFDAHADVKNHVEKCENIDREMKGNGKRKKGVSWLVGWLVGWLTSVSL